MMIEYIIDSTSVDFIDKKFVVVEEDKKDKIKKIAKKANIYLINEKEIDEKEIINDGLLNSILASAMLSSIALTKYSVLAASLCC